MKTTQVSRRQAWSWAIGVNLVVFVVLWVVFSRMPAPTRATTGYAPAAGSGTQEITEPGPGGTFGQMTHLVGDTSVADDEGAVVVSLPDEGAPAEEGVPEETSAGEQPERWVSEFYLDVGPLLSFAPRLNPDGTPRPHPQEPDRVKAPTYEDIDTTLSAEDLNLPTMLPEYFSKQDLPEELREFNFNLTVKIFLDRRGKVGGVPQIVRGSGSRDVDEITIRKIMEEVSFTPATRKDTGEPVPVDLDWTIFWRDPVSSDVVGN